MDGCNTKHQDQKRRKKERLREPQWGGSIWRGVLTCASSTTTTSEKKRVSFACCLVTAVWTTASKSGGGEPTGPRSEKLCDSSDALMFDHIDSVHHTVDSLQLELELPLVARYRVVEYIWEQCYRIVADDSVALPCRPSNVVWSVEDDAQCKTSRGDISSASLQVMDGFGLQALSALPEDLFVLHPYSRRLDPVTQPILAFLRRTCTLHLSQRQNNIIGLLPKLMEIIILLCHRLELATILHNKRAHQRLRHPGPINSDSSLSSSPACSASLSCKSHWVKAPRWTHRCAWWLSRLQKCANPGPHRFFIHVKELLLHPGPLCPVKADYLQHIACRFFPGLSTFQRAPTVLVDDGEQASKENLPNMLDQSTASSLRLAPELVKNSPAATDSGKWWCLHNG